jgi:general L-amino acid transport system permease protein
MAIDSASDFRPQRSPWIYDPKIRGYAFQFILVIFLAGLIYAVIENTRANLAAHNITSGFDFFSRVSGFDINQTLIAYSATATYGRAFLVGLLNTLLVSGIGIVLTTFLGFLVGIARLSTNFMISKLAAMYVEAIRNVPLLLQLLFWYNAVLKPLPSPRQSIAWPGGIFLNNRGLLFPMLAFEPGAALVGAAIVLAILASLAYAVTARRRQIATGAQSPVGLVSLGLILGLPMVVFLILGRPITFNFPVLKGFNFVGGFQILPEFVALLVGLVVYTAAFIAEIVRAGILAVSKGQTEAAFALGLRPHQTLKLIVIPQAMRVIIPPLTSEYLSLTKNSSLAVFIGYPDLVNVFAGTVLNQTGQALEVMAITMLVYLVISLATSAFMNWYNSRYALVER